MAHPYFARPGTYGALEALWSAIDAGEFQAERKDDEEDPVEEAASLQAEAKVDVGSVKKNAEAAVEQVRKVLANSVKFTSQQRDAVRAIKAGLEKAGITQEQVDLLLQQLSAAASGSAPAAAVPGLAGAVAGQESKKSEPLSSAVYVWNGNRWTRAGQDPKANKKTNKKPGGKHAERVAYYYANTSGAQAIGFVQNAWPCTAGEEHCTETFLKVSADLGIPVIFSCTHDAYAASHGKAGSGTIYMIAGKIFYGKPKKGDLPEAQLKKLPGPPP